MLILNNAFNFYHLKNEHSQDIGHLDPRTPFLVPLLSSHCVILRLVVSDC